MTGTSKLSTKQRESWRGFKYSRRTLVGEMPGTWKVEQGKIGSQLEKGLIESGMFSDANDTMFSDANASQCEQATTEEKLCFSL